MSIGYEDAKRLTDRQKKALESAEKRAAAITGTTVGLWDITYAPETRPGRGHDITAWHADGEHVVTQYLDVYGHGALVVASMEVLHNDADEDHFNSLGHCPCRLPDDS